MANCEINLFFISPAGFDGHLKLTPGDGEKGLPLIKQAEEQLIKLGCKPKPAPVRGGGGGGWQGKKQPEPVPGKQCPKCKGPVKLVEGKRQDGSQYSGLACMKQRDQCGGWINIQK